MTNQLHLVTVDDREPDTDPHSSLKMGRRCWWTCLLIALVSWSAFGFLNAQERPNIILVMTDDQGWGDVEFSQQLSPNPTNPVDQTYAGHPQLKTPQLTAMAAAGIKFNRFYAAGPVCSPTRASFLTGRHHRRTRVDTANNGRLLNREITIAELAKTLGYNTGHFGKWHLGTLDKSVHTIDSNRGGTDRLPASASNFSAPWNDGYDVVFATEARTQTFNPTDLPQATHYWQAFEQSLALNDPTLNGDDSRVIMDRVIPFLQNAANNQQPFLATIWFHTPHMPYNIIDVATLNEFYSPAEQAAMNDNERGYYSALTAMDKQMGRLRQELQALNIANETILVFTSDNGPEDGVPGIDGIAKGNLRGNKRHLFEGGVRVPAIVEWPGQIISGSSTDAVSGVIDLLPTLVDIWEIEFPDDRPMDGESILPILAGSATGRSRAMYWDHQSLRSIVDLSGQYKALSINNGSVWQLYDLIADPKETIDLANANPNELNALIDEWNLWRSAVDTQRNVEIDYRDYILASENVAVDASSPDIFLPTEGLHSATPAVVMEKQFFTFQSAMSVDADGSPGTYDDENPPAGATISANQVIHSYLFHFAPPETSQSNFTVTFANEILGVVSSEPLLESSDFLAFANPTFFDTPSGDLLRGLDFHDPTATDGWTIMPDGKTISVSMQSTLDALDEIRVITAVEVTEPGRTPVVVTSLSDARLVGFTTNSRDDNNGGGNFPNLIGLNKEGVDNFTLYEFDTTSIVGESTSGATVAILSDALINANHGSSSDLIVLNELAAANTAIVTGVNAIVAIDNLTDDGSVSFLNRVQFNDFPGPPSGATQPWLNDQGLPAANLLDAMTPVAAIPGFGPGESPDLVFEINQEAAQRWIDNGLPGLVVSTIDDGDGKSRFELLASATIVFEIDEVLLGDVNCDGVVNLLDVQPFVDALSTGQFNSKADINQDGVVNLLDVAPFILLLVS